MNFTQKKERKNCKTKFVTTIPSLGIMNNFSFYPFKESDEHDTLSSRTRKSTESSTGFHVSKQTYFVEVVDKVCIRLGAD